MLIILEISKNQQLEGLTVQELRNRFLEVLLPMSIGFNPENFILIDESVEKETTILDSIEFGTLDSKKYC